MLIVLIQKEVSAFLCEIRYTVFISPQRVRRIRPLQFRLDLPRSEYLPIPILHLHHLVLLLEVLILLHVLLPLHHGRPLTLSLPLSTIWLHQPLEYIVLVNGRIRLKLGLSLVATCAQQRLIEGGSNLLGLLMVWILHELSLVESACDGTVWPAHTGKGLFLLLQIWGTLRWKVSIKMIPHDIILDLRSQVHIALLIPNLKWLLALEWVHFLLRYSNTLYYHSININEWELLIYLLCQVYCKS